MVSHSSSGSPSIADGLLAARYALNRFALKLTFNADDAADLLQETLITAWAKQAQFKPETNLKAWLFTIMRNLHYSLGRRKNKVVSIDDGWLAQAAVIPATQGAGLDMADFNAAFSKLPALQQEALLVVGALGLSYDEAADVLDVPVGTIKSRVCRARADLVSLLDSDFNSDALLLGAATHAREVALNGIRSSH